MANGKFKAVLKDGRRLTYKLVCEGVTVATGGSEYWITEIAYRLNQAKGMSTMRDVLLAAYLDYFNNYLSTSLWAEHNGLTEEQGAALIDIARKVARSEHPDA